MGEPIERAVQRQVSFVELDTFGPDLADDATPERVVAIDHDDLARRRQAPVDVSRDDGREHVQVFIPIRDVRDFVAQRVVDGILIDGVVRVKVGGGDHVQPGHVGQRCGDLRLDLPDENALGRGKRTMRRT